MKLSIIIPAHNEEGRILASLVSLSDFLKQKAVDFEIIVSEDGSSDNTCQVVRNYMRNNNEIILLHSEEKLGKGGGILKGTDAVSGNIVLITDADLSVSPTEIPRLLDAIEKGADVAIGSRNLPESELIIKPPYHRIILGKTFNLLFRHLFHVAIYDTQCGFKAIKANVLKELADTIIIEGFAFDVNLIVEAIRNNYKVTEVPITWSYRQGSKVNSFKQAFIMALDLSTVFFRKNEART